MLARHLWNLIFAVALISQLVTAVDIHVDEHHGVSNTTCCPSSSESSASPCKTLPLALECVLNISLTTPVSLIVNEGDYTLTNDSSLTVIEGRTGGFTISGNCSTTGPCVQIECEKGAGLSFIKSDEITLENLNFTGCGFLTTAPARILTLGTRRLQVLSISFSVGQSPSPISQYRIQNELVWLCIAPWAQTR